MVLTPRYSDLPAKVGTKQRKLRSRVAPRNNRSSQSGRTVTSACMGRMSMKWNCMLLVLVTFLIGGVATADAQSEFAATLSGTEEVPEVGTIAFGTATFDVNFSEGTLGMNFHLSATNLKQAFMAHVHCAPAGDNGPIVLWLAGRPSPPGTATYNLNGPWIGSAELGDAN